MDNSERIEAQLRKIEREENQIQTCLNDMPAGSATIYKSKGRVRVKRRLDGNVKFMTNDEKDIASQLLLKRYLLIRQKELAKAKAYLIKRLVYERDWNGRSAKFLRDHHLLANEISSFFRKEQTSMEEWMSAPAAALAPHQEGRTEPAVNGIFVRSKSEVMIAAVLDERGFYYRYEEPLCLAGKMYFPDFTIRDPRDGKLIWLEHFGMMDNKEYARSAFEKLTTYAANGILQMYNLITTFESREHKLSIPQINYALDMLL